MLNSSLCDYSDAYIIVEGRITAIGHGGNTEAIAADRNNKVVVFKTVHHLLSV